MDEKEKEYLSLRWFIEEVRSHSKDGIERIRGYYDGRKDSPPLIDPPHEILERRASQFITQAIGAHKRSWNSSTYEVCLGCGTEILLKAIILLKLPEDFIASPEMSAEDAKNIVIKKILSELEKKKKKRLREVIELIQLKRNNFAHLSFHRLTAYYEEYQVFNVLEYLYATFFPESKTLDKIKNFKKNFKVGEWGMDFEPIDFQN